MTTVTIPREMAQDIDDFGAPARVDTWYDRSERSWVAIVTNERGDQLGDSIYSGNRADHAAAVARFQRIVDAYSAR